MKVTDDRVLITGFPRSGHRFLANLVTAHGKTLGYETDGPFGAANWRAGGGWDRSDYQVCVHTIRHPYEVIGEWLVAPGSHHWLMNSVLLMGFERQSPMEQAANQWIAWNYLCYKKADIVLHVDKLWKISADGYEEFCQAVGVKPNIAIFDMVTGERDRYKGKTYPELDADAFPPYLAKLMNDLYEDPAQFKNMRLAVDAF